eukprot:m.43452 g.43452  ORF g.43452 m.43452 type:complete len:334 (-) comp12039_c0_seq1:151-1152(-)
MKAWTIRALGIALLAIIIPACIYTYQSLERIEQHQLQLLNDLQLIKQALADQGRRSPHQSTSSAQLPAEDGTSSQLSTKTSDGGEVQPDVNTIHFMFGLWDDGDLPQTFANTLEAWRRVNPAWKIKLWRKDEIKALWRDHFPEYKHIWARAKPIQRADIARLMIILKFGGLYADLDCTPSRPVDDVFDEAGFRFVAHEAIVCLEDDKTPEQMAHTARWPIRKGVAEYHRRVANYVFWAKPGAKLVENALKLAIHRVETTESTYYHVPGRPDLNNPYAIIYTTGPDVLTEAVFPLENGKRSVTAGTLVIGEGKCYMTNKATGTWIGDKHPAWGQ